MTHAIPQITVDALSDAKSLLYLNDNPGILSKRWNYPLPAHEQGYMRPRRKDWDRRRALAPIANTVDGRNVSDKRNHPWQEQSVKPFVQRHGQMDYAQYHFPLHYCNPCDTMDVHPFIPNIRMTGSHGKHGSTLFDLHKHSGKVIDSNQVCQSVVLIWHNSVPVIVVLKPFISA